MPSPIRIGQAVVADWCHDNDLHLSAEATSDLVTRIAAEIEGAARDIRRAILTEFAETKG